MTVRLGRGEDIYELLKVASLNGLLGEYSGAVESTETGFDIGMPHGASGADVWIPAHYLETGCATSPHGIGGADIWIPAHWLEQGSAASPHAISGADILTLTPIVAGRAESPHAASGADILTHISKWPVTFPATPILDNFNRADGPLGPNWVLYPLDYPFVISSHQVIASNVTGGAMYYLRPFGADAEVYLTCVSIDNTQYASIILGDDPTTYNRGAGYILEYTRDDAGGDFVQLIDGYACLLTGTFVSLGTAAVVYTPGDSIGIRAVGSSVKAYHKPAGGAWAEVIDATVGVYDYARNGGFAVIISQWSGILDDFGGGPLMFGAQYPSVTSHMSTIDTSTVLDDSYYIVLASAGLTVTLPEVDINPGQTYTIVRTGSGDVIISPGAGHTISGSPTVTIGTQWDRVTVAWDGDGTGEWVILSV